MSFKVAVVGATGNVGRQIFEILVERSFPVREVVALASSKSAGKEVAFGDERRLIVQALDNYDFSDTDIALFSPGASVSKVFAPKAAEAKCVVIDNTSHFRMMDGIPLVVPEVNSHALKNFRDSYIIANPNCSTAQLVVALKPLHDVAKIKRVVVSTYQSVSGAGKDAMDELYDQTKQLYMNEQLEPKKFTKRIAFNVIPHIDVFMDSGDTKEEWKMVVETKKIMEADIPVTATCVRVPVFVGHGESVNIEFEKPMNAKQAREILDEAEGIAVVDRRENGGYTTPMECAGEDGVFVSRIRDDASIKNAINMWVVADNLRKGAALNAVQIAESLIKEHGLSPKRSN